MKKIIILPFLFIITLGFSQEKRISKSATITFEASVPSFEEVKATNNSVTFVLNPSTGEVASLALMKGFRFKVALMEEHFNENYVESDAYPKAVFKGKIEAFDANSLTPDSKNFILKGKLELHGKSREITTVAKISKSVSGITIVSNFSVLASDFNITIPTMIKSKLSNKINVQVAVLLK